MTVFLNLLIDSIFIPGCKGTPFVSPFLHASHAVSPSELKSGALESVHAAAPWVEEF